MDDQVLLQKAKDLTLGYLQKIGAGISESDGLYTIEIPHKFEQIFGGLEKRITFDFEIAGTHSCEYVILGSNFLAIILNQIKKQAPVVGGHLKKHGEFPVDLLDNIKVHNGTIKLVNSLDDVKIVLRFYFNINLKSVKNTTMLEWVDIDFETLEQVEFPKKLDLDYSTDKINFDKNNNTVDDCYDKAITILQKNLAPMVDKHSQSTKNDQSQDLDALEVSHKKRLNEINQAISIQKLKLKEFDVKIKNAKKYETRQKYAEQKRKQEQRIIEEQQKASIQINKLTNDKKIQKLQITKRYTPTVNSSLIASQVFSYSVTKCTLEIKNPYSLNKTIGEYLEHSQEFVIMCRNCKVNSEQIHLCVNGHVGCNLCTEQCIICKKDVCQKCAHQLNPCSICKEKTCNDCSSRCKLCNELTCSNHMSICPICKEIHCTNDILKCPTCDQLYGKECVISNQCGTCRKLTAIDSNDSQVLEIIKIDSDLDKYKKWECATNSKFVIFLAKKTFGKKIIVFDKDQEKIVINKKAGWL